MRRHKTLVYLYLHSLFMPKKAREHLHHCAKSLSCVLGVVLIWHGIGWLLDIFAQQYFAGYESLFAMGALVLGVLILYLPDKDLSELQ